MTHIQESDNGKIVYLDHAATTPIAPSVLSKMLPYMKDMYANPSALYSSASAVRSDVEKARRHMKSLLGGDDGQLFFTSGGTEANNWAINGMVRAHGIRDVITSSVEHSAVLAPIRALEEQEVVACHYVALAKDSSVCYESLEALLKEYPHALVSLMHGNNELGNLTDIVRVAALCKRYNAFFHSDMVQTIGYYPLDLASCGVDLCSGSAHKLYGPKGVGFLYLREGLQIAPLLYGGQQERTLRGGTEHVAGIIGMAEALSELRSAKEAHKAHITQLKKYMIAKLEKAIPEIQFYGACRDIERSLCSIINVGLEGVDKETFLLKLSMEGIAASSGSACMSGSKTSSHVLRALNVPEEKSTVRFSLGWRNTYQEIDYTVEKISAINHSKLQ